MELFQATPGKNFIVLETCDRFQCRGRRRVFTAEVVLSGIPVARLSKPKPSPPANH